ncbi:uncharacterized membrane protein [[Candida] jaroonii]|uniref:Uncharacterized membrane protein n=1 Tax=[Candida] jaroonii TaxID=467808 RepID=A0ACA9Y704_9ASCO|nr:uncharacterized membrane protein [[Candida] jaroonii]
MRFSEPLSFSSLFAYLYFMIRDFKIAETEDQIPKFSGYLASSYAFCQFLFSVRWGKLSDKVGRKPILMCGLVGTATSMLCFGFSKNFYFALFARCLQGTLNANASIYRTVLGECCKKKYQAIAFSLMPLLFNLGSVIGPLIGSSPYLTRPKAENPYKDATKVDISGLKDFHNWFLDTYPYALSNIVIACFLCFSLIIGFLFLEETHEAYKDKRDIGLEIGDWILRKLGFEIKPRPWARHRGAIDESTSLLESTGSELSNNSESSLIEEEKPIIFNRQVILAISSNVILSSHSIVFSEFVPVFLGSEFKPDIKFPFKIFGGFGFSASAIGTLFSSTGIMGMLIILIIFPWLDKKLGTLRGYRFSLSILPWIYFFLPWSIFTLHKYNPNFPTWLTPAVLYSITSLRTLANATGLPQIMLISHRSAHKNHRAYVNSFNMSMLALSRFLGPTIFGYIMSYSDNMQIEWLGWWILGLLSIFGFLQSFMLEDGED